jgi:hypothetical protein
MGADVAELLGRIVEKSQRGGGNGGGDGGGGENKRKNRQRKCKGCGQAAEKPYLEWYKKHNPVCPNKKAEKE